MRLCLGVAWCNTRQFVLKLPPGETGTLFVYLFYIYRYLKFVVTQKCKPEQYEVYFWEHKTCKYIPDISKVFCQFTILQ